MYIRRIRPSEAAQMRALRSRAVGELAPAVVRDGDCSLAEFERRIRPGSDAVFVAHDAHGHLVAVALAALDAYRQRRALIALWAEPSGRGAAAADRLVEAILAAARQGGVIEFDLRIVEDGAQIAQLRPANRFSAPRKRRAEDEDADYELVRRLA